MSKIVIDAGHGGQDAGAVNGGLYEKAAALKVAKMVGGALSAKGHTVLYTRSTDVFVELKDRAKFANSNNADYFISIHCNSAENASASGIETWYCEGSTKGRNLASCVQNELAKIAGAKNRGVKAGSFYVLKNTEAPAILVELGFISNEAEKKLLFKEFYQQQLCDAIVSGVTSYLK